MRTKVASKYIYAGISCASALFYLAQGRIKPRLFIKMCVGSVNFNKKSVTPGSVQMLNMFNII